jgi:hypothetical protein
MQKQQHARFLFPKPLRRRQRDFLTVLDERVLHQPPEQKKLTSVGVSVIFILCMHVSEFYASFVRYGYLYRSPAVTVWTPSSQRSHSLSPFFFGLVTCCSDDSRIQSKHVSIRDAEKPVQRGVPISTLPKSQTGTAADVRFPVGRWAPLLAEPTPNPITVIDRQPPASLSCRANTEPNHGNRSTTPGSSFFKFHFFGIAGRYHQDALTPPNNAHHGD